MDIQPSSLSQAQKKKVSAGYFAAFISLGMITAALGPALPYLAEQTHSALSSVSILFVSRAAGLILGALISGKLYDRIPGHTMLIGGLVLVFVTCLITPLPSLLIALIMITFISGIGQSVINMGGNTLLVWAHGSKVAPWMNGLHFFFGVGTITAPLIITWVLATTGNLVWAFVAIAALMLVPLVFLLRLPKLHPETAKQSADATSTSVPVLVFLIAFFFFCYSGTIHTFGGWIYTYTLEMEIAGPQTAGILTSVFWGTFTLTRLFLIPISARVRPRVLLWAAIFGSLFNIGMMMLMPGNLTIIWVGTILLGITSSPMFAATMAFAERNLHLTGRINSFFIVGLSLGFLVIPWLVGQFFESVGPPILFSLLIVTLLAGTLVFYFMTRIAHGKSSMLDAAKEEFPS
jgi:MFS transporter, FHS family, Na+ dependent glucose transporter 1